MRYFLDTEFIESGPHRPIDLISIGIVAEDGREFYAVSTEFLESNCNQWVRENVLPHLFGTVRAGIGQASLAEIREAILQFCDSDRYGKPEFWGYYADYDWVVFCHIFGAMIDLPKSWPKYCRDLKQWCDQIGNPKLPVQDSAEHNALHDARWNKQAWEFLNVRDQCGVKV
jgi:hypothetical protein